MQFDNYFDEKRNDAAGPSGFLVVVVVVVVVRLLLARLSAGLFELKSPNKRATKLS